MTSSMYILSSRSIFKVSGSEAAGFLNRVLTCRVDNIEIGQCRPGALLTPQGKILTDLFLFKTGDGLFLDLPVSEADTIVKRLSLLKLRADVAFEAMTDLRVFVSETRVHTSDNIIVSAQDPRTERDLVRGIIQTANAPEKDDPAGWKDLRFRLVLPECGLDYPPSSLFPADINMDLTVSVDFKKGCFIGQEVASRMKRKTEVRKRTLHVSGTMDIAPGDVLTAGESSLGDVLNWHDDHGMVLTRLDRLTKASENDVPVTLKDQVVEIDLPDFAKIA